jgi:hypothetical protein
MTCWSDLSFDNFTTISYFLHPLDLINITDTCQELYKYQQIPEFKTLHKYLLDHVSFVKKYFSCQIRSYFGGLRDFLRYPVLHWQPSFQGSTDYIDNINPEDVSHPIMIGIDSYQRPFITLRTKITNLDDTVYQVVDILFQRFTDCPDTWVNGCSGRGIVKESGRWLSNGNLQHRYLVKNIQNLLSKKGYIEYLGYGGVLRCLSVILY